MTARPGWSAVALQADRQQSFRKDQILMAGKEAGPAITQQTRDADQMLDQRHRRLSNIEATAGQRLPFAVNVVAGTEWKQGHS